MNTYETLAKVEDRGEVRVAGVPFQPGTEVRVIIAPQRATGEEFALAWAEWCREIRKRRDAGEITEEEIQKEIDDYRAGQ